MLSYDGALIQVINWAKYNPRTDAKKPTWFRMENSFFTGPKYFDLNAGQKLLLVIILSSVSQSCGESVRLNYAYLQSFTGLNWAEISETVQIYIDRGVLCETRKVTLRDPHRSVRDSPATNERTNVRTNRREPKLKSALPPLCEIWNANCGGLPQVMGASGKRAQAIAARWAELPDPDAWGAIVRRMAASRFCQGLSNDPAGGHPTWKADFDFLIRPDTRHKVLEGKYDNRVAPGMGPLHTPKAPAAPAAPDDYVDPEEVRRIIANAFPGMP